MKIFFCAHDIVEFDGESYYSNPISSMVNRYGEEDDTVICYAPIVKIEQASSNKITRKNTTFIDAPKIENFGNLLSINHYLKEIENQLVNCKYAIIHIHVSLINYLCVLAAKRVKIPYITVVVGCSWDALWNHSFKGKIIAPLCFFLEKLTQKKSKYSIYVTDYFLQKRYPTNGKSISCSNVELDFKEKTKSRKLKSNDDIINIATVAAVNVRYKGQQYVIKALAKLKESNKKYIYHIVGAGDDSYLRNLADKYKVSEMVVFHGPIPHNKISEFLDGIDIYIQPSKQEGLPRSVIEAMSRGCLCMGSDIAGIPELIDHRYLFHPGCSNQVIDIFKRINNQDIYEEGIKNIEKANRYSKQNLDAKRTEFINNFKKEMLK